MIINKANSINELSKSRTILLFFTIAICSGPFLLNLFGIDFTSQVIPLSSASIIEGKLVPDHLFKAVSGALHHALLEWSAVVLAVIATLISFIHYQVKKDVTVPIIGLALLSAGIVDAFHTLAATRIISASAPNTDFIPFTWALSRVFNASIMLVAAAFSLWLSINLSKNFNKNKQLKIIIATGLIFGFISAVVVITAASSNSLPQTMFPQALITRPYDVLPLALFLCGGYFYWLWYSQKNSVLRFALLVSILPEVVTQLHMAFGSTALFDNHFNIAHFLKNVAYGSILLGFLIDLVQKRSEPAQVDIPLTTDRQVTKNNPIANVIEVGKIKWPIAVKIPLVGFLLSLLISLVIGFTFYIESHQLVMKQEMNELTLETKVVGSLFDNFFQQGARDVSYLSASPSIVALSKAVQLGDDINVSRWQKHLNATFIELLKTKPHYNRISYISVVNTNDVMVSAVRVGEGVFGLTANELARDIEFDVLKPLLDKPKKEVFFSAVEIITDNERMGLSKQSTLVVAMPIFAANSNSVIAIMAVELNLSSYINELKLNTLKEFNFYLADNKGQFIYANLESNNATGTRLIYDEFPQLINYFQNNTQNAELFDFNHHTTDSSLAYYSKIHFNSIEGIAPLMLLIESPNEAVLMAVKTMRSRAVLIGISLAILCLVISLVAARRLTRPLSDMTKGLASYEKTGAIVNLPIDEKDEIGLLARSFHNMFVTVQHKSTQQRLAAEQAENASIKLQAILNSIVDAVITINGQGKILAFNVAAQKIFGYQEEEVLNQNINMLMPVDFATEHDGYLQHYLSGGDSRIINVGRELPAIRKDGETFPMHLSISEVYTQDGAIFTGLIRDITDLKLLDAENKRILTETKNVAWRLNFALSAPNIGVWDQDLTSDSIHWDDRMYQLFGVTREDNISPMQLWEQSVDVDERNTIKDDIQVAIESGNEFHYQFKIFLPNNEIRHIDAHAQVMFDDAGNKVRIVGTNQDFTEQINLQELKQHALEMAEGSLRLKSEFLASMSHEIRTPMNGVLGMLGLLEQSQLSKQQQHHLKLANSSAQSLLLVINDILDFSKIEAGKLDLEILDFDLRSQLGDFAESMAVRAEENKLELILDVTGISHSRVKGDPSRLRQILSNLVGNSIKFTKNGEVVIKASIKEQGDKLKLSCSISDTGIGIPEEKIGHLFDSFTQVDATTTRKYGGTGLGLAIVKQLCELMGGHVEVESQLGIGSCFSFVIELETSEETGMVIPTAHVAGSEILIVDDNTTNLEVLKGQLEIWGAIVTQAADGFEALDIVAKQPKGKFSAAILDMQMPGMDGAMLGKSLVEHENSANTKLIMMTSMGERGDAEYFANLGFSAYFPKPATTSDLFDALSIVLDDSDALNTAQPLVTHHHLRNLSKRADVAKLPKVSRILLVEDNRINQAVILGVLSNIELHADVANNGIEALDLLRNSPVDFPYEIIIMDCQMPELDGYETTVAIRKAESGERYKTIPIIAMTANAMKGDEEKCLTAGMDDYASKPVDSEILQQKLCHWLGEREETSGLMTNVVEMVESDEASTNGTTENNTGNNDNNDNDESIVWQEAVFLKRIRNNIGLAEKLIALFLEDAPELVKQIVNAIEQGELEEIHAHAHKLKGSTKNLGGDKLAEVAEFIEQSARTNELDNLGYYKEQLIIEYKSFINAIQAFNK